MKGFFNYDGYLSKIMTRVMYVVSLNLLFLLCSIPIFTIGAAQTAMYTVLLRYMRNDEPDIIRSFFRAFLDNFKKSTTIWLMMLAVGGTLALNYYFLYQGGMNLTGVIRILLNLVLIILLIMWVYIFPVLSYFDNTIRGYIRFVVGLSIAKLPYTVALVLIQTIPILAILFLAQYIPMAVLLLICCGVSLPAYYSGKLLLNLFKDYEGGNP